MNWKSLFIDNHFGKGKIPSPIAQVLGIFAAALLMMLAGGVASSANWTWMVAGAMLMFYALVNSVLSIFAAQRMRYYQFSLYGTMFLFFALGGLAQLISGQSIFEGPANNRSIFIVLLLAYFSLMALAFMLRSLADFMKAKDEEIHKN
ncbi:hypothetical protein PPO43_13565 [Saprospira sp. CCB-QB6]|uniref:hypothetical protein n=1 Tax=Saprospira sp. CCB-QB6 TaxID=3023936 RepID=UPI0023497F9B|nr:hypothetical protein [Saprospira sp. CCB-QB6]WCL80997.1 hypothetical protein PPO43_13565 [Saprospira sp. CCB-QB6]